MSTRVRRMGDSAWRWERLPGDAPAAAAALLAALRRLDDVVDVVVTEQHVLVSFAPGAPEAARERAEATIAASAAAPAEGAPPRTHVVRVRYDGEDLAEVAAATRLSVDELCARHAGRTYRVRVVGFLPGFAYLGDVDARLVVPRRASPRPRVPAGALALAGPYTGIYPLASSGGWNLVGTAVDFEAFSAESGATLGLGDAVRFEAT